MTMTERGRWTAQRLDLHPPGKPLRERLGRDLLLMVNVEGAGWYASLTVFRRQYTLMHRSKAGAEG